MVNVVFLGLPLIGFLSWCVVGDALIQMQERVSAKRKEERHVHRGISK